jgi:hypothetical protein
MQCQYADIDVSWFYSTGISQRDLNYYEFLTEEQTRDEIINSVTNFWETEIKDRWAADDCTSRFNQVHLAFSAEIYCPMSDGSRHL